MNTSGVENSLKEALKNLSTDWQQTKDSWRDAKSADFEKTYLEPLPAQVARTVAVMSELNALFRKMRHDCE